MGVTVLLDVRAVNRLFHCPKVPIGDHIRLHDARRDGDRMRWMRNIGVARHITASGRPTAIRCGRSDSRHFLALINVAHLLEFVHVISHQRLFDQRFQSCTMIRTKSFRRRCRVAADHALEVFAGGNKGGWGGWGGWVGPVFWPFLLGDVFSYALWPYDYYYPFWSYGTAFDYDYGPYVPAYSYHGYNDLSNIYGDTGTTGDSRNDTHANQIPPEVTQSCGGFAPGVTSFPIDRIRQSIHPTGEQVTLLEDLATASSKASAVLNAA
jgi:hypothetical protein